MLHQAHTAINGFHCCLLAHASLSVAVPLTWAPLTLVLVRRDALGKAANSLLDSSILLISLAFASSAWAISGAVASGILMAAATFSVKVSRAVLGIASSRLSGGASAKGAAWTAG